MSFGYQFYLMMQGINANAKLVIGKASCDLTEIIVSRAFGGVIVPLASVGLTVTTAPADGVCERSSVGLIVDSLAGTFR